MLPAREPDRNTLHSGHRGGILVQSHHTLARRYSAQADLYCAGAGQRRDAQT